MERDKQAARMLDRAVLRRKKTRRKYLAVAEKLYDEAEIEVIEYHSGALLGHAVPGFRRICVPRPTTPDRLYVVAHECGHIALGHRRKRNLPHYLEEFEAELWAHEALGRHGVRVPRRQTARAKEYLALEIDEEICGDAVDIELDALKWCREFHTPEIKAWIAERSELCGQNLNQEKRRPPGIC